MNSNNLSLLIHGVLAVVVIASATVLAITLKNIPSDVVGLYGVLLGVVGANGAHTIATSSASEPTPQQAPPMQGGPVR